MTVPTKLGMALLVALASNATMFSLFFTTRKSGQTGTTTPTTNGTTTAFTTSNFSDGESTGLPRNMMHATDPDVTTVGDEKIIRGEEFPENVTLGRVYVDDQRTSVNNGTGQQSEENIQTSTEVAPKLTTTHSRQLQSHKITRGWKPVPEIEYSEPRPRRGDIDHEFQYKYFDYWREKQDPGLSSLEDPEPTTADVISESPHEHYEHEDSDHKHSDPVSEKVDLNPMPEKVTKSGSEDTNPDSEDEDVDVESEKHELTTLPQEEDVNPSSEKKDHQLGSENEDQDVDSENQDLDKESEQKSIDPGSKRQEVLDLGPDRDPDVDVGSKGEDATSRTERRKRTESEDHGSRSHLSTDTDRRLHNVIASLTDRELQRLDPATSKVLIRALERLERLVLRELERLHDVNRRQELRLERVEKGKLDDNDVMKAIQVIKEERYKLERQQHKEELLQQLLPRPHAPSGTQSTSLAATVEVPISEADDISSEPLDASGDGSGSGDEMLMIYRTTTRTKTSMVMMTTSTPAAVNRTENTDSAIFSHIHEIYNSLTSMEHKVLELDNRLSSVTSEVYRQRGNYVRVEERTQEAARNQKNVFMRTTMHGFKIADLEQFKGQAEVMLGSAEGTIEQLDTKLEILTDRLMEQEDEVEIMRNVFSRLEQVSHELRSADAFKAHDLQELRRGYRQVDTRLTSLHQSLDRSLGDIRWDVKTYLDHLCIDNHLQCS